MIDFFELFDSSKTRLDSREIIHLIKGYFQDELVATRIDWPSVNDESIINKLSFN